MAEKPIKPTSSPANQNSQPKDDPALKLMGEVSLAMGKKHADVGLMRLGKKLTKKPSTE